MIKWEYMVLHSDKLRYENKDEIPENEEIDDNAEWFNEKGSEGWELVTSNEVTELYDDGSGQRELIKYWFKRPIRE